MVKEISPGCSLEGLMLNQAPNTLATWCVELTHWKRPWCWERLKVGAEGDNRGWDGWMASLTQWTWVWVNSRSWWWTGRPGMLQSMGSQRVRHDWATELNWTELSSWWWQEWILGRWRWTLGVCIGDHLKLVCCDCFHSSNIGQMENEMLSLNFDAEVKSELALQ